MEDTVRQILWLKYVIRTDEISKVKMESQGGFILLFLKAGQWKVKHNLYETFLLNGQVLVCRGDQLPVFHAVGNFDCCQIALSGYVAEKVLEGLCEDGFFVFSPPSISEFLEIIPDYAPQDMTENSAKGYQILMRFIQGIRMKKPKQYTKLVKRALELMEERYPYIVSMDELAELVGVSKNYLIREFTAALGVSPWKFLMAQRIEAAKGLFAGGETDIEMTALAVGFSCGNYFSKVFKKVCGKSPREYILYLQKNDVIETMKRDEHFYL